MKNIFLTIGITILKIFGNIIYYIIKIFPTKNKIVMITRQSNEATLDFKLLYNYIKENNKEENIIILAKKIEGGIINKLLYSFYILKIMFHLATSKVCIVDGYSIPVSILKHKKTLKIIQIWHASGAVKKFGYQILDKKEGSNSKIAKLMCMHKNYDYVIAPSDETIKTFSEAFNVKKEKFVKLGLPRLEYLSNSKYDISEDIYKKYPNLKDKKNILYIPTFRKNNEVNILDEVLNADIDEKKYNLIIKLHPLDKTILPEKYLIDKKYSSFDLVKIADYIITDYSALSIESSILNKPIIIYVKDIKTYEQDRGLNINLREELSSFVCEKFNQVMDKIDKKEYNMKQLSDYRNKYIEIDTQNTISSLAEFILKLKEGDNDEKIYN